MGGTVLQTLKTVTGWIINYFASSYPNAFKMIYYGAKLGKVQLWLSQVEEHKLISKMETTRMIILILTAIILYLLLWSTIIHYLVKMKTLTDMDKKLHFTYNTLGAVALEQIIALIAIIIFYAVKLNDIEIAVPEIAAIFFMALLIAGFILTGYFWFVYRRKYFPEYVKKGKIEKKAIHLNHIITVGFATSAMNFIFNLLLAGAIAYIAH